MHPTQTKIRILFVYLADTRISKSEMEHDITELWQLVEAMGDGVVVDLFVQKGPVHDSTYIGQGKAEEVAEYVHTNPIDVVVLNGTLKPRQKFNLLRLFWDKHPTIEVWDRVDLILAIFSRHARTMEAKLQIKLAQMQSMGPRIYGMGKIMSNQGGGIGTRGIGETNTELMLRHWKREIKKAKDELATLNTNKQKQIALRKLAQVSTVSLVGYTNAGKTSLFNLLTNKNKLVEDQLFATLDSSVGKLAYGGNSPDILVSDTIGFIANLPPQLIEAFTSTLLESIHADIILHVVDASDPAMQEKITVVKDILKRLGIPDEKQIVVLNKIDQIDTYSYPHPAFFVSSKTKVGLQDLVAKLKELVSKR